ncbi:TubC N-terminal docking domain-related protein [Paraburkholderia tropica]|uniref:TubC N-terminal docking domain-related protein n=1 Tax=Paraburkholderia tropica TaxID=92647 RepID=UPI002ABD55AF|nr:hypothetical protein [Paraburkholderia tropica]
MSIADILSKAQSLGVRLTLDGDTVKMRGPADAIAVIKPEIASRKPEIVGYLRKAANAPIPTTDDCVGALRDPDGGPYLPWGPYIDREQLAVMQRDLLAAVEELARRESWPDEYFDHVVYCIERQPISTLRPDLAYFNERLRIARNSRGGP